MDGFQLGTFGEGLPADDGHGIGQINGPQGVAVGEGVVADGGDGVGEDDGGDLIAVPEAVLCKAGDGLAVDDGGDFHLRTAVVAGRMEGHFAIGDAEPGGVGFGGRNSFFWEEKEQGNAQHGQAQQNQQGHPVGSFLFGFIFQRRAALTAEAVGGIENSAAVGTIHRYHLMIYDTTQGRKLQRRIRALWDSPYHDII